MEVRMQVVERLLPVHFIPVQPIPAKLVTEDESPPRSSDLITDSGSGETAPGPVTSVERQARWRHRGGVLELSGPAVLIHAVERSLLLAGAAIVRIDLDSEEFALHSQLLDAITVLQTRAGVLTLLVRAQQDAALTAHTVDQSIFLDISQPNFAPATAVAAVHRLLYEANILISPEWLEEGSGI
jgi:hypothetical protein